MNHVKNLDSLFPDMINSRSLERKSKSNERRRTPMFMNKLTIVPSFISKLYFDSRSAPVHR
jgi:hypothetical protein